MMASEFTLESLKEFMLQNGGRVKNHELVTHFKSFLNDPSKKDERRDQFKNYVNTLATIKVDEQNDKILVLKKKFRPDAGGGGGGRDLDYRAQSEPPGGQPQAYADRPDGRSISRSDGNLTASDLRLSQSTISSAADDGSMASSTSLELSNFVGNLMASDLRLSQSTLSTAADTGSMASSTSVELSNFVGNLMASDLRLSQSTLSSAADTGSMASSTSVSSATPEDDVNDSVVSVKDRAKHLNRMESESEIQKAVSPAALGAVGKKNLKKSSRDGEDGEDSTGSGYVTLEPIEKEWLVTSSAADYHPMHQLLSKNPELARVKDFTSTALHWAAKHGRTEVIKMLIGKPGVLVNQRTGYTPLHLAAMHGHEEIIELLIQGYKADPNIRDYSGKKPKQYLRNSASSRVQHLLVSSRLGSKANQERIENNFMRNTTGRRSNRASAIKSLIQASSSAMKQTVMRTSYTGSSEDLEKMARRSPSMSPRHSAEPSPRSRRKGSFSKDRDLMPPPSGVVRSRRPPHSISKESLCTEDKRLSTMKQVSRSESEPNLGEMTQTSKSTII